jgi:hypothetical protein
MDMYKRICNAKMCLLSIQVFIIPAYTFLKAVNDINIYLRFLDAKLPQKGSGKNNASFGLLHSIPPPSKLLFTNNFNSCA